jgi:hypothetical protein
MGCCSINWNPVAAIRRIAAPIGKVATQAVKTVSKPLSVIGKPLEKNLKRLAANPGLNKLAKQSINITTLGHGNQAIHAGQVAARNPIVQGIAAAALTVYTGGAAAGLLGGGALGVVGGSMIASAAVGKATGRTFDFQAALIGGVTAGAGAYAKTAAEIGQGFTYAQKAKQLYDLKTAYDSYENNKAKAKERMALMQKNTAEYNALLAELAALNAAQAALGNKGQAVQAAPLITEAQAAAAPITSATKQATAAASGKNTALLIAAAGLIGLLFYLRKQRE